MQDDFYPPAVDGNADGGLFSQSARFSDIMYLANSLDIGKYVPDHPKATRRAAKNKAPVKKQVPTATGGTKLRLLVTTRCHNSCPLCCNNQFKINDIPIVDRWDYDEVCITGGEPLSNSKMAAKTIKLIESIKTIWTAQGKSGKIYIYTASHRVDLLRRAAQAADGLVYTIHNKQESHVLCAFICHNGSLINDPSKSFRLNYFKGEPFYPVSDALIMRKLRSSWKIKELEWIPNCPVPEGEDFRRIRNLY